MAAQDKALKMGREARRAGVSRDQCPYDVGKGKTFYQGGTFSIPGGGHGFKNAWLRGWDAEDAKIKFEDGDEP